MQQAAHHHELTRFDVALPFLAGAIFAIVGWLAATLVYDKVCENLHTVLRNAKIDAEVLPYPFRPESIAKSSQWTVDTALVLPGLLSPGLGLILLLRQGATGALWFAYAGAFLLAFAVYILFLRRPPDEYGRRWPSRLTTPITVILVIINLTGAAAAGAIGP